MNNNNNFWDFVSEMNQQGRAPSGPSRGGYGGPSRGGYDQWDFNPWGFPFGAQGPMPYRGRFEHPHPHPPPAPPAGPEGPDGPPPPPPPPAGPPSRPGTPPTPPESAPEDQPPHDGPSHREPGRPGRHGHGHGHGPCRRGRGGRDRSGRDHAPWTRGSRHGQPSEWEGLPYWTAQLPQFLNGLFGPDGPLKPASSASNRDPASGEGSFSPEVDIYNMSEAYIIHAAMPGAKKADLDVSYDSSANAVKISGVVQRPAEVDEAMMATLSEGGRRVGLFERTVYFDKDTKVDADGMSAKLEDGILRVEVPKLMEEDWTEVRKVQVE